MISTHFGEGAYVETENQIRGLLGLAPLMMEEPKQSSRGTTAETYLGSARGNNYTTENIINPYTADFYTYHKPLEDDAVGLKGPWRVKSEYIEAAGENASLDINFLSSRVYLVLAGKSPQPIEVFLDGKPDGTILVDSDRKYDIVTVPYGRHMLSLHIPQGVRAYAFTFGDE